MFFITMMCIVYDCFDIVIFFFKQKTAYEMRISDWSSDVCSSDLFGSGDEHARRAPNLGYDTPGIGTDNLRSNDQIDMFFGPLDRYDFKLIGKQELLVPANSYALHSAEVPDSALIGKNYQIGRSYCREGVSQYV